MSKMSKNINLVIKQKLVKSVGKPNTKVNCILMSDFTVFIALKTQILPLFVLMVGNNLFRNFFFSVLQNF